MSHEKEKQELIYWAQLASNRKLLAARSGNFSYKIEQDKILVTSHGSYLGFLKVEDILLMNSQGKLLEGEGELTSEQILHVTIYNRLKDSRVVLHAHSPYTIAFFHYFDSLEIFSFEARFYLGNVPVVPQITPTVTDIEPVLQALGNNSIVVLKNHGVVAIGESFKQAFSLIELLEEQAQVGILLKNANLSAGSSISGAKPADVNKETDRQRYRMLSSEHARRLTELINSDTEVQELGVKYNLTCSLAIKNQDTGEVLRFCYEQGKIVKTDSSEDADFMIVGKTEILCKVFNREIDPFVAATQEKVKLKGEFAKMSRWYPVMVRTFKLWEDAPVNCQLYAK